MFVKFSSSAIKIWYFVFLWIHWMENYCMTIFIFLKSLRSICQILGWIENWKWFDLLYCTMVGDFLSRNTGWLWCLKFSSFVFGQSIFLIWHFFERALPIQELPNPRRKSYFSRLHPFSPQFCLPIRCGNFSLHFFIH